MSYVHEDLNKYINLIESSHLNNCLNNISQSKKECLESINLLNKLSKMDLPQSYFNLIKILSQFSLDYYDRIKGSKDKSVFSYNDKVIWIGSKVDGNFYPPVIRFSDELSSLNDNLICQVELNDECLEVPESANAVFREIQADDWSVSFSDLTNLYQDLLSNCSFVASFLSIVDNNQIDLLTQVIVPYSNNSNYRVKLNFNGAERVINVDNKLPFLPDTDRNLIMKSSSNDNLYWPAIIEKAYLKVMGNGYKFFGSNMSLDTFMLLNWIPEIIPIKNGKLPNNFERIWALYLKGDLLVGLGTGKLSNELEKQSDLISDHDYVIRCYEKNSITLKNPWIEYNNENKRLIKVDDLIHFKYFYINWNPTKFFKFSSKINFAYYINEQNDQIHLYQKPQYSLINTTDKVQEIWLLLERHLPLKVKDALICISIYGTNSGEKILAPTQFLCLNNDNSTNNRLNLVKFQLEPKESYTIVISSSVNGTFTLNVHNNISNDFTLAKAKFKYPTSIPIIRDKWDHKNNGGNWSMSSFIDNPQYTIEVTQQTNLLVALFSEQDIFINFHIFHSERAETDLMLRNFDKSKLLFNANYNRGFQFYKLNLQPGFYKLILSTYENNTGKYKIIINHDAATDNFLINKDSKSLGLFLNKTQFNWENANRYKLYFSSHSFNSKFTFHLKHFNHPSADVESISSYRPSIRGSVFNASNSQPIQINDKWNNSIYGTFIDCNIQEPGTYILLVERFEVGIGRCVIEIGCNKKFEII